MRKTFFITIFTLLSGLVSAQTTDYKKFRTQNQHPTCTVLDSVIVNDVLNSLLVLDTNQFDANLDDYYQDLAGAYYQVYLSRQDTSLLRNELYSRMAQDLVFQKVLLDAYAQNKANLAFKIKPNNAYVFHFIPSVKDNIYGISLGPIGSEAICNAIRLRRTHGVNIQLIGQGFFIPMNREEFAFEQILLPLDSLFFTTQNARALHNGLLLSAFGTYTDFSNGIVLSAGCSFGRKVNGLAVNLFANKYYVANGVELGIQNQAHKVNGLQIGLFNRCVELNGLQIGLWNVNEKRKLPIVNW